MIITRYSLFAFVLIASCLIFVAACRQDKTTSASTSETSEQWTKPRVPEWHKNATIYEVNLRHYTKENTFKSFEAEIPRLKEMGIDILWFMPIQPIGKTKSKGTYGSPYSVADYMTTNPQYGTPEDFKHMVKVIHDAGMKIIIDWVPNHTSWDHPWIKEHPEYYTKGKDGKITDPIDYNTGEPWGWTDVADLNYDVPEMRQAMIKALKYWIMDLDIDGFRMDVAHGVPVDFWAQCSDSLYAVKPIYMLSEGENPAIVNNGAFISDYAWEMHHLLNQIAETQGANRNVSKALVNGNVSKNAKKEIVNKNASHIDSILAKKATQYTGGYQMNFTSNHDENSWADTEFARMGDGHKTFAVLTSLMPGLPLVYTGQESAMDKKLLFFEKDSIPWGDYIYHDFYKRMFDLKHRNKALWNGTHGGPLVKIPTGNDQNIYAFSREKDGDKVIVILNLSSKPQKATLKGSNLLGASYKNIFTDVDMKTQDGMMIDLKAWDYIVLSNK
jgi:alpha-amylase